MDRAEAIKQWRIEFAGFLNAIGIVSLRTLGRYVGVSQATARKKGELVDCILAIVSANAFPRRKATAARRKRRFCRSRHFIRAG